MLYKSLFLLAFSLCWFGALSDDAFEEYAKGSKGSSKGSSSKKGSKGSATTTSNCAGTDVEVGTSTTGNDIGGCGLEGCDPRYLYADEAACRAGCDANLACVAYSWCPTSGDQNHAGKVVCTLYDSTVPTGDWGPEQYFCVPEFLTCPKGTTQLGTLNTGNDIGGCGLEECDARYSYSSASACAKACKKNKQCVAFSWTAMSGDKNHANVEVCTLYDSAVPNQNWGPRQIFCDMASTADEFDFESFLFGNGVPTSDALVSISSNQLVIVSCMVIAAIALWMCYSRNNANKEYSKLLDGTHYGSTPHIMVQRN